MLPPPPRLSHKPHLPASRPVSTSSICLSSPRCLLRLGSGLVSAPLPRPSSSSWVLLSSVCQGPRAARPPSWCRHQDCPPLTAHPWCRHRTCPGTVLAAQLGLQELAPGGRGGAAGRQRRESHPAAHPISTAKCQAGVPGPLRGGGDPSVAGGSDYPSCGETGQCCFRRRRETAHGEQKGPIQPPASASPPSR